MNNLKEIKTGTFYFPGESVLYHGAKDKYQKCICNANSFDVEI